MQTLTALACSLGYYEAAWLVAEMDYPAGATSPIEQQLRGIAHCGSQSGSLNLRVVPQ